MCYSIMVEEDLQKLAMTFDAVIREDAFTRYEILTRKDPGRFKPLADHPRIFPRYFAPLILRQKDQRSILPMRYRIRPAGSAEEVPSKYNMFNARMDALHSRQTWRRLFGRQHGILAARAFYEWVPGPGGKKKVICFRPSDDRLFQAPALYDLWVSPAGDEAGGSFAIITTDPPEEVRAAGHDRCPVFIKQKNIDAWLDPGQQSLRELQNLLADGEEVRWVHEDATPG